MVPALQRPENRAGAPASVKGQRAPPHASREIEAGDQALLFAAVSVQQPASGPESRLPGECP